MAMENTVENVTRKLPNRSILDVFNVLVEGKDNERLKATETLLTHLRNQQSAYDKGLCEDATYVINRLVTGLSSDRKFARVGYSTALCQVLRTVDEIHCKDVLKCIQEKTKVTSSASNSEERNAALGKAFGLLTLVNSGKVLSSGPVELSETVEELRNLSEKKSYLQLLCLNGVVQVITEVSHDVFKQSVLPHVKAKICAGWGECSPDTLHLVLVSYQHHPTVVKKFLKEHWQDEQLISEKNFPQLADVLSKCTSQSYEIHPVVDQILTVVNEKQINIGKFWKQVCKHLLISEKRIRVGVKQTLGLYMFQKILPFIDSPKKVKEVMHPDMASAFIQLCSKKTEDGTKGAKKTGDLIKKASAALTELANMTAASTDAQFQIEMLKCLTTPPGSFDFDSLTNTNTVSKILSQLVPEAMSEYIEELTKGFRGQSSWIVSENKTQAFPQWCVQQLGFVCNNADSTGQQKILEFLFLQSFFTVKKNNKDLSHCTVGDTEVTKFQRKCASDSFFKTLTKLLTKQDKGVGKAANLNLHIDLLYGLSKYVQQLLRASDCVELIKTEYHSQIVEEWNKLESVINVLNKKRNPNEILDGHAFELLFIFFGLQMFEDPQNMQEALQDLHVCYKNSTKRRKSVAKEAEGPSWIDVVTELLLSMIFKENKSSRVVGKQVMSFLTDHVTHTTVQLLVDALEQTNLDSEEGMLGVEDDGEDIDDDNDGDGDDDVNDKTLLDDDVSDEASTSSDDDDSNDDEGEDSDIEEETDVVVADKLKEKVRVALGDAASNFDEEDDSDEDAVEFSDSEMFKLDDVLASAFKSMIKGKKMDKRKTKQLLDFKMRVLDLVEALVKSNLSSNIAQGFIVPLLDLMEKGMRKQKEESLGNRAQGTLRMLLKHKNVKADTDVDRDELLQLLEHLMKRSNTVPVPSFRQDTGNACLFVLNVLLAEPEVSPLKTRSKSEQKPKKPAFYREKVETLMQSAILDLLSHKPGHCQPALFHIMIVKFPLMFWSCHEDLINTVQSQTAKVFVRSQAAAFLAKLVSKELLDSVDDDDWEIFVTSWKSAATVVIREMAIQEKFRKNLLEEVVSTCSQIQLITPGKLVLDKEDLHRMLEMQRKCEKSTKKAINRLTQGIERTNTDGSESQKSQKMNKKRKKKQDEVENQSPEKKSKLQNQSENNATENQSQINTEPTHDVSNKQKKKNRKSWKKEQQSTGNVKKELVNQSIGNGVDTILISENKKMNEESVQSEKEKNVEQQVPESGKKKKKRKSKGSNGIDNGNEVVDGQGPVFSPQSQEKAKQSIEAEAGNQSPGNDVSKLKLPNDESMSGKKRKRKSKQLKHE